MANCTGYITNFGNRFEPASKKGLLYEKQFQLCFSPLVSYGSGHQLSFAITGSL
jgi:hypothetical protein